MRLSSKGLELIKKYEGLRLSPYLCPAGVPTIGYGATYYPGGELVKMTDPDIPIRYSQEILISMLERYEKGVQRYVQSDINQNQFDALVSFSYNLGLGSLKRSTLLKKVNKDPLDKSIHCEFGRWVKAGKKKLKGLIRRRAEEANLYFA